MYFQLFFLFCEFIFWLHFFYISFIVYIFWIITLFIYLFVNRFYVCKDLLMDQNSTYLVIFTFYTLNFCFTSNHTFHPFQVCGNHECNILCSAFFGMYSILNFFFHCSFMIGFYPGFLLPVTSTTYIYIYIITQKDCLFLCWLLSVLFWQCRFL